VSLTVLLAFVAIAIDGGLLQDTQKQVQATADASAMAAAANLFANYQSNGGRDPSGTAAAAATKLAAENGYPNITVNIPPQSGPFTGKAGYVEVIIVYQQTRYFSTLMGSDTIPVRARAVAEARWAAGNMGILVLDPTAPGALTDVGGGQLTVSNAPLIVNSNAPNAATATGGGVVSAPIIDITGVPGTSGSGTWNGTIAPGQPPTPDPLKYLPEPDPTTMPAQSSKAVHASSTQTLTLSPGVYMGGIQVTGQASLIMQPGIYYMKGGGFAFSGSGSLTANGVMIFNAPQSNSDVISINGTGSVSLTPPTTGIYTGISLFQERSSTNTVSVSGNGGQTMSGTFYVAGGTLNVAGNGANNVIGAQYISDLLTVNGNGNFVVNWQPDQIARVRILKLVE
jgi:hypothetical protein